MGRSRLIKARTPSNSEAAAIQQPLVTFAIEISPEMLAAYVRSTEYADRSAACLRSAMYGSKDGRRTGWRSLREYEYSVPPDGCLAPSVWLAVDVAAGKNEEKITP